MILLIDNYDSFTYNLVQYLGELTGAAESITVVRNDEHSIAELLALKPSHVVISPGPCTPAEAGVSIAAAQAFATQCPVLGVCLGHQAIAAAFGGEIVRADKVIHGKTSRVFHTGTGIFAGIEDGFQATRYHSLVVRPQSLPDSLEVLAWSEASSERPKEIMSIRHRLHYNVIGVQFHPESILTSSGKELLSNFLSLT